MARVMSALDIEQGTIRGKINSGQRDLKQSVNAENAVAVALQSFEDGLYFVFVDDVQQTHLDDEVFLKSNSKVVFMRLTALTGG